MKELLPGRPVITIWNSCEKGTEVTDFHLKFLLIYERVWGFQI